jgi:ATP/maltotriose-dependent transcriptional regulator MalT
MALSGGFIVAIRLQSPPTSEQQRGSAAVIRRPHLCARIASDGGAEPRVTTLVAPAGYGKSSLLCELVGPGSSDALYLSLRDCEHHPSLFLDLLATAVHRRLPEADLRPLLMLKKAAPAEEYGERLPYVLARVFEPTSSAPVLLALDDVQCIEPRGPLSELIRGLLESEPSRLRVVLASRRALPFDLSAYAERGELLALRARDLAFQRDELTELLTLRLGSPPSLRAVKRLWDRTRGWPVVVGVVGLDEAAGEACEQGMSALRRFVVEELLGDLRPPLRYVLKAVSILDGIESESARALLSEPVNGRQLRGPVSRFISVPEPQVVRHLEVLSVDQIVASREPAGQGKELNPAIREVLSALFQGEDPRAFRLAHHRVAEHYLHTTQDGIATIEHLVEAGDLERAMSLLEPQIDRLYEEGAEATVSRWLRRLEAHFKTLPLWVSYYLARGYMEEGELEQAKRYLERCKAGLRTWEDAGVLWRWHPRLCFGFATVSWRRGMGDEARTYCRRGLDFMRQLWRKGAVAEGDVAECRKLQLQLLNLLATLKLERGIYDKAQAFASEAVELAQVARSPKAEAAGLRQLGAVASYRGHFSEARASLDAALGLLDASLMPSEHALASFDLARLMRREGHLEAGRTLLESTAPKVAEFAHPGVIARAFAILGEARGEDGDTATARDAFTVALAHAAEVADAKIGAEVLDRHAIFLARLGEVAEARAQLRRASDVLAGQFKTQVQLNAHHYETRAECAAANRDYEKVELHFGQAIERAQRIGSAYHVARLSWHAARHLNEAFLAGDLESPEPAMSFMVQATEALTGEARTSGPAAVLESLHVGAAFGEEAVRQRCLEILGARGLSPDACGVAALSADVLERYRDYRRRAELEDDFVLVDRTGRRGANARDVERAISSAGKSTLVLWVDEQALLNGGKRTSLAEKRVILPLLRHFLCHPGEVFTMAQLSSQVWGSPDAKKAMQTKVKVAVSRLRSLLGKDRPYITTSRVPQGDDGETVVAYGLAEGFDYLLTERVAGAQDD